VKIEYLLYKHLLAKGDFETLDQEH